MPEIAVLLTTYNSSSYLAELLRSLLSQTYTKWQLFVRDDMSTDNTREILEEYASQDRRIHVLEDSQKRGPKDGFMWLLSQIEADYYMFCDHDDVWLPEKISESINLMTSQDNHLQIPLIVSVDLKIVDANLNVKASSFMKDQHYGKTLFNDKYFHLFYNNIPGCAMLFNRRAKEIALPDPMHIRMHDAWVATTVLWNGGKILHIDKPLILYRQHGLNTVGVHQVPSYINQLSRMADLFRKTWRQYRCCRQFCNMGFLNF